MGDWLDRLFQTFGLKLAAWVGLLMVGVHWIRAHNERLRDRATEKNGSWARMQELLDNLAERLKIVEAENEECRQSLAAVRDELAIERAERMKLAAIQQGYGEARNLSAIDEALKRGGK